jgi:hypothetical protein
VADGIKNLTERDLKILKGLYVLRAMTVEMIHSLYFKRNKKDYTYQRLSLLRKAGYIASDPLVEPEKGRKLAACYYVTDKGISALYKRGLITVVRRSKDVRVKGWRLVYKIKLNHIFLDLCKHGWKILYDSRGVKEINRMNRNALIQALLISPEDQEYGFYLLNANPAEKTVIQMAREISELVQIKQVVVLCECEQGYQDLLQQLNMLQRRVQPDVHIYPYSRGMLLLKTLYKEVERFKLYSMFGTVTGCHSSFTPYGVLDAGKEKYIVELLTHRPEVRQKLAEYNPLQFTKCGKEVLILVAEEEIQEIQEEFRHYRHFTFETISNVMIEKLINPAIIEW